MKICYINFNLNNPRDQITLMGLRENGVEVKEISDNKPGFAKYINIAKKYRPLDKECDLIMIGYSGNILVIFMRLITRKKIVFNTLSTFYDSMILSRFEGRVFSLKSIGYYIIDFLAFRFADIIFLECQNQKDLVTRIFYINPNKIQVHFVGVNDKEFFYDSNIQKSKQFTVLFRGMFLPEAGIDVIVRAGKEIEDENIKVRIIGRGLLLNEVNKLVQEIKPNNLELITEKLPIETLREKMLECHVSLGQFAKHPRVNTTIPHKAFESMAMKLPYLTGDNKGIMEVLENNVTCFSVPSGDYKGLAKKILDLRGKLEKLEQVSENAYQLYKKEFTPKILAQKIIKELELLR